MRAAIVAAALLAVLLAGALAAPPLRLPWCVAQLWTSQAGVRVTATCYE